MGFLRLHNFPKTVPQNWVQLRFCLRIGFVSASAEINCFSWNFRSTESCALEPPTSALMMLGLLSSLLFVAGAKFGRCYIHNNTVPTVGSYYNTDPCNVGPPLA